MGEWELDMDARILDYSKAVLLNTLGDLKLGIPEEYNINESNVDIIAILSGYDIIKKDATINVLNRGKLYWLGFIN